MLIRLVFAIMLSSIAAAGMFGQKLPDKVRGYKSYNLPVVVRANAGKPGETGPPPLVRLHRPQIDSIGLSGITVTARAEIKASGHAGKVDFLTFRDFTVNGVRIEIDEYTHAFPLPDRGSVALPAPFRILIPSTSLVKTAFREIIESKQKWAIAGTVLVFGRFKKYGLTFKRVVAVPVDIEIENPLNVK